jgi:hypothetical protein
MSDTKSFASGRSLARSFFVVGFDFSDAGQCRGPDDGTYLGTSGCAPAFAESFFERGVNNFVCTGWPVGDRAARLFSRVFYGQMLGLMFDDDSERIVVRDTRVPSTMAEAMRAAREAVRNFGGLRTWGAYQHYGNPFTNFFLSRPVRRPDDGSSGSREGSSPPNRPPSGPTKEDIPPEGGTPTGTPPGEVAADSASTKGPELAAKVGDARVGPMDGRFDDVRRILRDQERGLRSLPGVVDVRLGYHFENRWITNRPALVAVVSDQSLLPPALIPHEIEGVPIDVRSADPFEQLRAMPELAATAPQIVAPDYLEPGEEPQIEEMRALTAYRPPPAGKLEPVEETLSLICHLSPDCGWPVLSDFLDAVDKSLLVAMYDFTAPHVRDGVRAAVRPAGRTLKLVLDPALSLQDGGSGDNPKADDVDEDAIVAYLRQALGSRFEFVWAAVTHHGKVHDGIFPKAYHIKVAARDGTAFWLSSGNWQSSNQPPLEAVPRNPSSDFDFNAVLRKYNREWHVVVENETLADTFATFIKWDLKQARPLQEEEDRGAMFEIWPDLLVPFEEEERGLPRFKPQMPLHVSRKVKIQPVLTPDNYPEIVEKLIAGARKSIRFQNQYINITKTIPPGYDRLLKALKAKCDDEGVQVRIILRKIGNVSKMLEALQAYSFDTANSDLFRLQRATHTKGIIVDDAIVLIGSHNWSSLGTTRNRDASLLIDDQEVAAYFAKVFDEDWKYRAKAEVPDDREMPRVANPMRDLTTREGLQRLPCGAYFEDADDFGPTSLDP